MLGPRAHPFLLRSKNGLVFTSRHYARLVRSDEVGGSAARREAGGCDAYERRGVANPSRAETMLFLTAPQARPHSSQAAQPPTSPNQHSDSESCAGPTDANE